ncbi:hypothetical protein [Propionibacterium sp.]|uniref:hypothetical protein n=1 Tax=Propionibacterium sp. TaxID=1977903 RepID=UPI0039E881D1
MTESAETWLKSLNSLHTPLPSDFDGAKGHRESIESRLDFDPGGDRMFEIDSL